MLEPNAPTHISVGLRAISSSQSPTWCKGGIVAWKDDYDLHLHSLPAVQLSDQMMELDSVIADAIQGELYHSLDKRHGLLLIPEWWELHDHIGYFC
jgi:hypothetical protein